MSVRVTHNAGTIAAQTGAEGLAAQVRIRKAVAVGGAVLQRNIKAKARAPRGGPTGPEPRLVTGNYNRSITRKPFAGGGIFGVSVGTNAPQGRRLEGGFSGTDAAGRTYDDPPRPHFGPGFDETVPVFVGLVEAAVKPPDVL